jgi:hypothetical protein
MAIAPLAIAAAAGCGGSSKPAYCSDRSQLEQSVRALGNGEVLRQGGLQDLKTKLQTVEPDANNLVGSAKEDFPSETGAIETSVSTLKTTVQQLPSSPTPQQVAAVAADTRGVVTSFQGFREASDSKCS